MGSQRVRDDSAYMHKKESVVYHPLALHTGGYRWTVDRKAWPVASSECLADLGKSFKYAQCHLVSETWI